MRACYYYYSVYSGSAQSYLGNNTISYNDRPQDAPTINTTCYYYCCCYRFEVIETLAVWVCDVAPQRDLPLL